MEPSELAKRAERIRLRHRELIARTGLHANTVSRALKDEPKIFKSTETRLLHAITAEELALRDYLIGLHPLPAVQA